MSDQSPLLPDQWSASYVSYWSPMLSTDQITSGFVWFDYPGQRFRIDGLFNPWDEAATGHRLWMSEIGNYGRGKTYRLRAPYHRIGSTYLPALPYWEQEPLQASLVPQDQLRQAAARLAGTEDILGHEVNLWSFERPNGKGAATYAIERHGNRLVRMITGDLTQRTSIRDFFNFSTDPIPAALFERPLLNRAEL